MKIIIFFLVFLISAVSSPEAFSLEISKSDPRCPAHLRGVTARPLGSSLPDPTTLPKKESPPELELKPLLEKPVLSDFFRIETDQDQQKQFSQPPIFYPFDFVQKTILFFTIHHKYTRSKLSKQMPRGLRTITFDFATINDIAATKNFEALDFLKDTDLRYFLMSDDNYKSPAERQLRARNPERVIEHLSERNLKIVIDVWHRRMSTKKVAGKYQLTRGQISRIIRQAQETTGLNFYLIDWQKIAEYFLLAN